MSGETWTAIGKDDEKIPVGTKIKVTEIDGVKAIVVPIKK